MRVVHVVRDLSIDSGGPSRTVSQLAHEMARFGHGTTILYRDLGKTQVCLSSDTNVQQVVCGLSKKDAWGALRKLNAIDIIHSHGLWDPINHWACTYARANSIPVVLSPRGMLETWALAHRGWKKRIAWWLYQRRDVVRSRAICATGPNEAASVSGFGVPISVIPNGTELPKLAIADSAEDPRSTRFLFLSRIHPIKGLETLIHAASKLEPVDWSCELCGPIESPAYQKAMQNLIDSHALGDRIWFSEAKNGEAKWNALRAADVLVLPSHSENFGLVVAEALAVGTPAISTQATPWEDLRKHNCGWWVANGSESLADAMTDAIKLSRVQLCQMGLRGRQLVEQKYSWEKIARSTCELYAQIVGGDELALKQTNDSLVDSV